MRVPWYPGGQVLQAVRPLVSLYSLVPVQERHLASVSTVTMSTGGDSLAVPGAHCSQPVSLVTVPTEAVHSPARQGRCGKHTSAVSAVVAFGATLRNLPGAQLSHTVPLVSEASAFTHLPAEHSAFSVHVIAPPWYDAVDAAPSGAQTYGLMLEGSA